MEFESLCQHKSGNYPLSSLIFTPSTFGSWTSIYFLAILSGSESYISVYAESQSGEPGYLQALVAS